MIIYVPSSCHEPGSNEVKNKIYNEKYINWPCVFFRSSLYLLQSVTQHQPGWTRSDKATFTFSNEVGSGYTEISELLLLTSLKSKASSQVFLLIKLQGQITFLNPSILKTNKQISPLLPHQYFANCDQVSLVSRQRFPRTDLGDTRHKAGGCLCQPGGSELAMASPWPHL